MNPTEFRAAVAYAVAERLRPRGSDFARWGLAFQVLFGAMQGSSWVRLMTGLQADGFSPDQVAHAVAEAVSVLAMPRGKPLD